MSRGIYASDEAPQWYDEIEAYANGAPEKDRDVERYLRHVSSDYIAADVLKSWDGMATIHKLVLHSSSNLDSATANVVIRLNRGSFADSELAAAETKTPEFSWNVREHTGKNQPPVRKAHRLMWLILCLISALWGVVAGASIFAGVGVSQGIALFGLLANIVLAMSLFRLSSAASWSDR